MNEHLIEGEKQLGKYHCQRTYRKAKTYLALHTVPAEFGKAGAQAWHAEAARIIDEELAAQMQVITT